MRWLAALALFAVAAGCGVKADPLAPELVQPEPPRELVGKSVPEGIHLTWARPTHYSGGKHMRDLGGFEVERAEGTGAGGFARVGTVELTDQTRFRQEKRVEWTDTSVTAGATYRYRVVAYTLDGYRSAAAGPLVIAHKPGAEVPAPSAAPEP